MLKYLALVPFLLASSTAEAQSAKTEFVTGDGLVWSSPCFVDFALDVSQRNPDDPVNWMVAEVDAFPQHLVMPIESTGLTPAAVDKRTAMVVDVRSGFEGEVQFSAVFDDANTKKRQARNDFMGLTLFLPTGMETFSGEIALGGIEVGKRRR